MKKLFLILIALLLAFPAQAAMSVHRHLEPETLTYNALAGAAQTQFTTNENIKAVKYVSGVTLSSVTAKMSTTATGLITGASIDLRPYSSTVWGSIPLLITVNDGTKNYTLTPGAAGTGETYTELITNGSMSSDEPPGTAYTRGAGVTIASGVATLTGGGAAFGTMLSQAFGSSSGKLVKYSWKLLSRTAGAISHAIGGTVVNSGVSAVQTYSGYATASTTNTLIFSNGATQFQGTIDDVSDQQVLTADTSGLAFTNGSGATFNPNVASFTVTVQKAP